MISAFSARRMPPYFGPLSPQWLIHAPDATMLADPRAKRAPAIDLHWNLAQGDYAYLNYVPEAVEANQKRVSALPGFWLEGPSAALELGPEFTMKPAEQLLEAMVGLKVAAQMGART